MSPEQLSLLEPAAMLPEGFAYREELVAPAEESELIARFGELPLREFEFHSYLGRRRVVSFGLRYDFADARVHRAEPIPEFLLPLRDRAALFAGLAAATLEHALVTEYMPGAAIGWHRDRPIFGDVVGVSFASACRFRFRRPLPDPPPQAREGTQRNPPPQAGEGRVGGQPPQRLAARLADPGAALGLSVARCCAASVGAQHPAGRASALFGDLPHGARLVSESLATRPLLAIDGDNFGHRSYHALPKTIRRKDNRGAGAIVGFANFLLRLYENEKPRAVLVGWDTPGAPTYRQALFPAYQAGRVFADELVEQLAVLPEFVAACGFANAKRAGWEADDFLAAAATAEEARGGCVLVASGDRDAFQLASARTTILHPLKAGEMARIGPAEVGARYGVAPSQVPDFIALRGDPSDGLPGARGVGPKGAAAVLHKYRSLEEAFAAGLLAGQAAQLRIYRQIAAMDRAAPLPSLPDQIPTWHKAAALARDWQLPRLAARLDQLAAAGTH